MTENELISSMKKIRLIALDLDGTTLRSDKTLAPETRDALVKAIDAGIEVVIASGRPYGALLRDVVDIPGIHYAITSNGAVISTVPENRRLHNFSMPPEAVDRILELFPEKQTFECFIDGVPYAWAEYLKDPLAFGVPYTSAAYLAATRNPVSDMRAFLKEHRTELDGLDLDCPSVEAHEEMLIPLKENVQHVYITSSQYHLIEISNENCGKHTALQWLCDHLNLPREAVAAFGDGANDHEMLEFAGLGVAVANADPITLEAADFVTLSNDDLGVADAILKIIETQR